LHQAGLEPRGGEIQECAQLWHLAYREAAMLAFIVATLLVPLLRNVAALPAGAASNAH
jgi:hypothetical protein